MPSVVLTIYYKYYNTPGTDIMIFKIYSSKILAKI
jgi:hypothetical protein